MAGVSGESEIDPYTNTLLGLGERWCFTHSASAAALHTPAHTHILQLLGRFHVCRDGDYSTSRRLSHHRVKVCMAL